MNYDVVDIARYVVNKANRFTVIGHLVEVYTEGFNKSKKDISISILLLTTITLSLICVQSNLVLFLMVLFVFMRIINIVCVQCKVIFMWWPGSIQKLRRKALSSFRRSAILLLMNITEVVAGYVVYYKAFPGDIEMVKPGIQNSWISYIHGSLYNMFGIGKDVIEWSSEWGQFLVTSQNIIGWFFTVLSLSIFVSLLGQFKSMDRFEKQS